MRKVLASLNILFLCAWTVTALHCLEEDLHDHHEIAVDHGHEHEHSHPHRTGDTHQHACACFHHVPGDSGVPCAEPLTVQPCREGLTDPEDWLLAGFPEEILRPPRA